MVALTENPLCASGSRLHDLLGGIGRGQESFLSHIPILGQVFTEMVGIDEDTNCLGYRLLLSQFLGTAGSKVGDAGAQGIHIRHHARERARSADALTIGPHHRLLTHVLHGDAVLAVQLLPGSYGHHVVQGSTNP